MFILDQRLLPVFKNYHPGKPSNRLYLKNLAKQVEEFDLHFIYRRYVLPSSKENDAEYVSVTTYLIFEKN